ncbi:DUF559 domain-containing protein [Mycobacterium manitobense]|uniref:DUF559 domain-containing protein n=1 Tax=[Mycobacterium] manitobense TaxID=190147 RepID=A0A9X3BUN1_9MYCO|nr:DUF559 domain-containing protein [[Mycobacterium] manitobense]MCV7170898.1 DUF559 domain-containing protein [[Mycobacterium] manitobense]
MHPRLIVATEALADGGLTRRDLMRSYRKVHRNVYVRVDTELSALDRARAAWLWSGRKATLVGHSAAVALGSRWIDADAPVELAHSRRPGARGILVHSDVIRDDEVCLRYGMRCTTPARTAYDLARRLPHEQGVIRVDALLNASGASVADVTAVARRYPGARGARRLREVMDVADGGAESPQETRLRLLLVRSGLPRPATQIREGSRRIDMGWRAAKVGVEYDGKQHWTDPDEHARDIERLEFLASRGWLIVRVSARQLNQRPASVVQRVRAALRAREHAC